MSHAYPVESTPARAPQRRRRSARERAARGFLGSEAFISTGVRAGGRCCQRWGTPTRRQQLPRSACPDTEVERSGPRVQRREMEIPDACPRCQRRTPLWNLHALRPPSPAVGVIAAWGGAQHAKAGWNPWLRFPAKIARVDLMTTSDADGPVPASGVPSKDKRPPPPKRRWAFASRGRLSSGSARACTALPRRRRGSPTATA